MQERSRLEGYDNKNTFDYLHQDARHRLENKKLNEIRH
jgi:hypothetical protein